MKDHMISMFIDDEMNIDEKIEFVTTIHADAAVKDETIGLLQQEKMIRDRVVDRIREARFDVRPELNLRFWKPAAAFIGGLAAALLIVFFNPPETERMATVPYRFVLYQPDAGQVELAGSFSGWKTLPMKKMGISGYWEVIVDLYPGEHHYSYILEGGRRIPDPTILTREKDDFGGENSILDIHRRI
ncbi:MAG: glycogen-binding domain-containing protein [Desulfobacterales bacterium]|jgi:hypothetical protein